MSVTGSRFKYEWKSTKLRSWARTFLPHERQTPREYIHEVWQPVWVRCAVELPYVHDVTFVLQNRSFVIVHVEIVRRGENGHNGGEARAFRLPVHAVAVSPDSSVTHHPA